MTSVHFRPPPLPPNRKNSTLNNSQRKNHTSKLSSTYLSFHDPAEDRDDNDDDETNVGIEMKTLRRGYSLSMKKYSRHNQNKSKTTTSSSAVIMCRSHSDSNLNRNNNNKNSDDDDEGKNNHQFTPMTINRYIKVLSGSWKNLLNLGGMSRPPKPAVTAKKVAPPAVPHEFRHSGSSFGSAGYASSEDAGFLTTNEPTGITRDDHSDYGSTVSGSTGKSPGPIFAAPSFTFAAGQQQQQQQQQPPPPPPPSVGVLTHKAAVYYHHQLSLQEDQGIDMTQSPGRDSPGSSSGSAGSGSRHSTASLDSGRASYHPLSTTGRSTIGSSNSPRCSLSSCSIGSADQSRIERMIHQGVPDQEIIHAWLVELQYDEYFQLFAAAGYDFPTIGRMTPEDLTAIGIKKPNHRKRLKSEIAQLNLPDNLPEFIPGSLEEWLQLLRLEQYLPAFLDQGYQTVNDVTQLQWEDLEEFGIVKLGHQKKFMLAIKRVKDIQAGKRINTEGGGARVYTTQDVMVHVNLEQQQATPSAPPAHSSHTNYHSSFQQPQPLQSSAPFWEPHQHQQQQQQQFHLQQHSGGNIIGTNSTQYFCTDIVPIKIRTGRGKSLESLEDLSERASLHPYHPHHPHHHLPQHITFSQENTQTFYTPPLPGWKIRSYDDGDITPTNETSFCSVGPGGGSTATISAGMYEGGGGTLPRPRGIIRPRTIAKVSATKIPNFCAGGGITCGGANATITATTTASSTDYDTSSPLKSQQGLALVDHQKFHYCPAPMGVLASGSGGCKKVPPNPPKRLDSCGEPTIEVHHHPHHVHHHLLHHHHQHHHNQMTSSSPLPLPAYPSSDSLSISLEEESGEGGGGGGVCVNNQDCVVLVNNNENSDDDDDDEGSLPPPPAPGTPPGVSTSDLLQQQQLHSQHQQSATNACCVSVSGTMNCIVDSGGGGGGVVGGCGNGEGGSSKLNSSQSWGAEEQELIKSLALQHRNGSDASFKSSSSTESDSLPFANENAGTIRTRVGSSSARIPDYSNPSMIQKTNTATGTRTSLSPPTLQQQQQQQQQQHPSPNSSTQQINSRQLIHHQQQQQQQQSARNQRAEPADVLNDIGNMLANLTDELDAMLEEEKRQQ